MCYAFHLWLIEEEKPAEVFTKLVEESTAVVLPTKQVANIIVAFSTAWHDNLTNC